MPAKKAKRPGKTPPARKADGPDFRVLFDQSPEAIYIHDLEGRILEANKTASDIMGYSLEEFKKMRVTDVDEKQVAAKIPERLKKVISQGGAIFVSKHKNRSGAVFPVEVNARPIKYLGKKAIIATVRDITQRKADEERQARLASITENTTDAILMIDMDNNVTSWNRGAERIFGYTEAEMLGRPITTLAPDSMKAQGPSLLKKIRGGAHLEHFETKRMRKNGEIIDVVLTLSPLKDNYGKIIGVSGAVHDITEQKRAEAALRKSEETLRKIIDQSPMSMAIVAMDGTIEYINKKSIATFGYLPEDIPTMERWWIQAYPEENYRKEVVARWTGKVEAAIAAKSEIQGGEYSTTCKDGSLKTMFIFGVVAADKVFVMFEDVTARKRAEKLLLESETKFRTLTENSMTGVYLIQDGMIKYANPWMASTIGYTPGELIGKKLQDVILQEDWPLVSENVRKRLAGETKSLNYEFRGVKKNGEVVFAEAYGAITTYRGKPAVIGTLIDRTKSKKAEEEIRKLNQKLEQRVQERTLELQTEVAEHKRTEGALRVSENKYRLLFDNIDDTILVHDAQGKFFDINRGGLDRLGYSKDEVLKMNLAQLDTPEAAARIHVHMAPLLKTGHAVFESSQKTKDGRGIPVEVNAMTFELDGKPAILSVSRDLTARNKAEAALHASEEKYRKLIETTETGYLILDWQGRVVDANREYVRMSGHKELREILGRSVTEWTADHEKQKNTQAVDNCIKNGLVRNLVVDYVDKIGRITPIEINATVDGKGKELHIISLCRDITDRKLAERELQRKSAILQTQQDSSIDGILMVDKDQKILNFNKRFVEIWGIPQEVMDSRSDERAISAVLSKLADPKVFLTLVGDLYSHNEKTSRDELTLKDGRVLDRYSSGVFGPSGEYYGRIWYFRDVTERRQAEEKIKELNQDLKHTVTDLREANRELEAFTYSVSHDLRTPLRHMTSFAKLLDEEAGDALKGQSRHYLDVVSGSARKMDRLITSLLAFSKLARAKPEMQEFSGLELAEEAAADIREDSPDLEAEWKISGIPTLKADRFMLKQVFINLLCNAVKYSAAKKPARIEVFARAEGDETIIGVRDNGIGFDMKQYAQLFGVFQRLHTDKEFEGTGIGLANVKNVISKHGGRVWAESVPDKETTFYFSLPAAGAGKGSATE